jgi:hypothetical protein
MSISNTLSGIITSVNDMQPENAEAFIRSTLSDYIEKDNETRSRTRAFSAL